MSNLERHIETTVKQSDGSDGYSAGTWAWTVRSELSDGREALTSGGGWSSRKAAEADARRFREVNGI